MLLGAFSHVYRADRARGQGRPPLAERLLRPGQLACHVAADARPRRALPAQRVGLRGQQQPHGLLRRRLAERARPGGCMPSDLRAGRRRGQPALFSGQPALHRSSQSGRAPPAALQRQHRAGHRDYQPTGSRPMASLAGRTAPTSGSRTRRGAQVRDGVERHRRWQDRDSRVHGHLLQLPAVDRDGGYSFAGGCPVSCSNQIRCATFADDRRGGVGRRACAAADAAEHERRRLRSAAREVLQRATSRSSATSASTPRRKSRGSATSSTRAAAPSIINRLPLYVCGNPANLVNNAALNNNSLRARLRAAPRHGIGDAVRPESVPQYAQVHALQLNVQRRLSQGFQIGGAYTLAKGEGLHRTTIRTPTRSVAETRSDQRYWGPTARGPASITSRVNYSYNVPDAGPCAGHQVNRERLADLGCHDAAERRWRSRRRCSLEHCRHPEQQPVAHRQHHLALPCWSATRSR